MNKEITRKFEIPETNKELRNFETSEDYIFRVINNN